MQVDNINILNQIIVKVTIFKYIFDKMTLLTAIYLTDIFVFNI